MNLSECIMLKRILWLLPAVAMFSVCHLNAEEAAPQPAAKPAEEAAPKAAPLTPGKTETYTNKEKGYTIELPADWTKQEGFMGLDVISLSPAESDQDKFRENASVLSGKLDAPITLDEFYTENLKNLQKSLIDFKLESSGDITIDGQKAKWLVYTHKQGNFVSKVVQYFIMVKDRAYLITAGAEPSAYDKFKPTFDAIVKSFHLTPVEAAPATPAPAPAVEDKKAAG